MQAPKTAHRDSLPTSVGQGPGPAHLGPLLEAPPGSSLVRGSGSCGCGGSSPPQAVEPPGCPFGVSPRDCCLKSRSSGAPASTSGGLLIVAGPLGGVSLWLSCKPDRWKVFVPSASFRPFAASQDFGLTFVLFM